MGRHNKHGIFFVTIVIYVISSYTWLLFFFSTNQNGNEDHEINSLNYIEKQIGHKFGRLRPTTQRDTYGLLGHACREAINQDIDEMSKYPKMVWASNVQIEL